MEKEKYELITKSVEGNAVKITHFKSVDNVLVGFVQDMVCGQPNKDYFRVATWRVNGALTPKYGGSSRRDLYLDLSNIK